MEEIVEESDDDVIEEVEEQVGGAMISGNDEISYNLWLQFTIFIY